MKKHYKNGKPVVRGRASIIKWDLEVTFLDKNQRNLFVKWLIGQEIDYSIEVGVTLGDSLTPDTYPVTIIDMAWGNNLRSVGKFLEEIDYNSGEDEC